jgi:hypothetical protein
MLARVASLAAPIANREQAERGFQRLLAAASGVRVTIPQKSGARAVGNCQPPVGWHNIPISNSGGDGGSTNHAN